MLLNLTDRTARRHALGQLLIAGFDGLAPSEEWRALHARWQFGGYVLFRRNIESIEQVAALNEELQSSRADDTAMIASVDQEGGRVRRLRDGVTPIPPMLELGRCGAEACAEVGELLARELAALGFNLNFAPVLDVFTEPRNTVIGDRAFSRTADEVSSLALAFASGHLRAGVATCGKHFPGHGDTVLDSHADLPRVSHPLERLRQLEWIPFRAAAQAELPMLMTAHVVVESIDPDWPATMSRRVLTHLREELAYDGLVVTDDLEMGAIARHFDWPTTIRQALLAGVDLFLVCHSLDKQRELLDELERQVIHDIAARRRIERSLERLARFKRRFAAHRYRLDAERIRRVVGSAEHRAQLVRLGFDPEGRG